MPYATNNGVRLHYAVEGDGPPLLLQHGFTDSIMSWYERGYVDALKPRHRLILVDARGHHLSDKPHDPAAYTIECFVADTVAVLDALGIERVDYFGYSMGGWIGFGMARHAPTRVGKLVIGGASPYPFPPGMEDPYIPPLERGAPALLEFFPDLLNPALEARMLTNDMQALIACRRTRFVSPGFADQLSHMHIPCLLFAGDEDPVHAGAERAAGEMPDARFVSIPGKQHIPTFFTSSLVLPHVTAFLADAETRLR